MERTSPIYSICMLSYNNGATLRQSIDSLRSGLSPENFEIIVVDNESTDGSIDILREYESYDKLHLIVKRCSRGMGRNIAFMKSKGRYILSHIDCDDIFSSRGILNLIQIYHQKYEGLMLMTKRRGKEHSNITIAPRQLLLQIGGWRDINWGEDWDLWSRAAKMGKYAFLPYPTELPPHSMITVRQDREKRLITKIMYRYEKYRDSYRIGRPPFLKEEQISIGQKVISWIAKIVVDLKRSKFEELVYREFNEFTSVITDYEKTSC